jgi:tellurite resistance protein
MIPAPSTDPVFNTEALTLLLQVAWADDQLDPKERQFVASLGPAWSVPESVMTVLLEHLDRGRPLPQPNLKLLRTKPDAVISAAEALMAADGFIDGVEMEFMTQLRELLGRPT